MFSIYLTFLHHPPPDEILRNQQSKLSLEDFQLDPNIEHSMAEIAQAAWGAWLYQNQYVSIGDVFDTDCGRCNSKLTSCGY